MFFHLSREGFTASLPIGEYGCVISLETAEHQLPDAVYIDVLLG
jgi:hypothetical protein